MWTVEHPSHQFYETTLALNRTPSDSFVVFARLRHSVRGSLTKVRACQPEEQKLNVENLRWRLWKLRIPEDRRGRKSSSDLGGLRKIVIWQVPCLVPICRSQTTGNEWHFLRRNWFKGGHRVVGESFESRCEERRSAGHGQEQSTKEIGRVTDY